MKLVVIIPAYNEEATIADVITEVPRKIDGIPVPIMLFRTKRIKDSHKHFEMQSMLRYCTALILS